MEGKQTYSITPKKLGHDTQFDVLVQFVDNSGTVLCSEKRRFRNDEAAAVKFATTPRELRSKQTEGGERNTTARDNDPRTDYYMVEARGKGSKE